MQSVAVEEIKTEKNRRCIMPRGDGTGPNGMGPMTGRAAGYCAGYATPGFANPVGGRGRGFGYGRGLGQGFRGGRGAAWGWAYSPYAPAAPYAAPATPTAAQEAEALKAQAEYFETQLDALKKRLAEVEAGSGDKA
jgi:hypothetical protein